MSNKSGVAEQVISLPRGGGALSGVGESFAPDLFTGTGNFSIPISVPAGRNGLQPELTLGYSTGAGNGPYGLGWGLGMPGISRKTSAGAPTYGRDPLDPQKQDVFMFSGGEDLVLVARTAGRTQFRPRTEGPFARIFRIRDSSQDYWEAHTTDGQVSVFGTPGRAGDDPGVVADPADRSKVFSWRLTETRDSLGNRIVYEYERDTAQEGPHHWDQLYPKRIRYVDFDDDAGEPTFLVSVRLVYEERPDPFSVYRAGFEIRSRKRCTRIEVRTHAGETRLQRSYHLEYLDQEDDPADALPLNGTSVLRRVRVVGHDGEKTEQLPPLEFSYTPFLPQERSFAPLTGRELPPGSLARPEFELADLFGNGLPDVLQMDETVRYWRNRGGGEFDLPRPMTEAPAGVRLADPDVQLLDADGDGRIDLMVSTPGLAGYFPLGRNGLWDRRSFQRHPFAPSFDLTDPEVRLLDIDGDGVTDAVRSGSRFEYFVNDARTGWKGAFVTERRGLEEFPDVSFADPRVRFGDMSGDGLQDVVLVHDGNIEYWPNFGNGRWGKRVQMRNSPRLPGGYEPRRILVGDVDGDGLADLVYVDHRDVLLFINRSGNAWTDPITIEGTPPVTDMDAVRLTDMLGTGVPGVLYSSDADALSRDSLLFLDFTGGVKPYVLREMNNNRGAITRVQYESSTNFFARDQRRRETRWRTSLPFAVQVVSRVQILDELSGGKITTDYSYHHGYWDGGEREFRGFGRVDQRDTQTFAAFNVAGLHGEESGFAPVAEEDFSAPTLTRTWFHLGPVGPELGDWVELDLSDEYWPGAPPLLRRPAELEDLLTSLPRRVRRDAVRSLRGTTLRTELYAEDDSDFPERPYTVTEFLHGVRHEFGPSRQPANGAALSPVEGFFPHELAKCTTQWERGDDPMSQFELTRDYDAFGQAGTTISIACPRGWRSPEDVVSEDTPFLATVVRTDFAASTGAEPFIKDRVARVTDFELLHRGDKTLDELVQDAANPAALAIFGQKLDFYDGDAFEGLPFGQVGEFGIPVRTQSLVLTEEIAEAAYRPTSAPDGAPEIPPYLVPGGPPAWTDEYPLAFRERTPDLAGYRFHDGTGPQARGYFKTENAARYDFHGGGSSRGLLRARRDPRGNEMAIEHDEFDYLPARVTDAAGLVRSAEYDPRTLQPVVGTDQNGNRTAYTYSPLGFVTSIATMGKAGESVGDTAEVPGAILEYDFFAFMNSPPAERRPNFVRTTQREHHVQDDEAPPDTKDRTVVKVEFSDGFGRVIQTRKLDQDVLYGDASTGNGVIPEDPAVAPGPSRGRAAPPGAPHVAVSGLEVFDNKGQVVRRFEPFFGAGLDYSPPEDQHRGHQSRMFYDPRGQLVKTVDPDGSVRRVIFGVPRRLDTPDDFVPTPWEAFTYDANDNAGSFPGDHHVPQSHFATPTSIELDALGRTIESVARNGSSPADEVVSRSRYDIRGNRLSVTDPAGRLAFEYVYDLDNTDRRSPRTLRERSIDGGVKAFVFDASGHEIERRDSKDALVLQAYDEVDRPVMLWARDRSPLATTLRQRLIYGDASGVPDPRARNLNGKILRHFDEAGLHETVSYDFKGNPLGIVRRVIRDSTMLSAMDGADPLQIDWETADPDGVLEARAFRTDMAYDALNRVTRVTFPEDVDGDRKVLLPSYHPGGSLRSLALRDQTGQERVFVKNIAYTAQGQRNVIAYGHGLMTRHAYDPATFRQARVRIEPYQQPNDLDFVPVGAPVLDLGYEYDLAGNIVRIRDRSPGSGVPGTALGVDGLDRDFAYDALYRMVSASGREHVERDPSGDPWLDTMFPTPQDASQTHVYRREYAYDISDNLTRLRHVTAGATGSFTRSFTLLDEANRIASFSQGGVEFSQTSDAAGNMVGHDTTRHFVFDHSNRLHAFRVQAGSGPASVRSMYLYDASGQRVKKLVRRQDGSVRSSTYIGNSFEHHAEAGQENNTLHLLDDRDRFALVRVGEAFPNDAAPAVQFVHGDQVRNSHVVVDGSGGFVRREEFYPFGGTSFGSFARKRYRFTGKERDEESGLSYHGARYYSPTHGRWISPDPAGPTDGLNLYVYARNSPVNYSDPTGRQALGPPEPKPGTYINVHNNTSTTVTVTRISGSHWFWRFVKRVAGTYWKVAEWTRLGNFRTTRNWTFRAWGVISGATREAASTIWNWSKQHKVLAGAIALGVAVLGIVGRKHVWNAVLAPLIRAATNAAFGYVLWGTTGAIIGGVLGLVHGGMMAYAGSYDWKSADGWLAFLLDNSWGLLNSFAGSMFATANIWNPIDDSNSKGRTSLTFKENWFGSYATTVGNVTVGTQVKTHEAVHAWQARILGPYYIPLVIHSYAIATLLPYWLLHNRCDAGISNYFDKGVYPYTLHELVAYAVEGDPC